MTLATISGILDVRLIAFCKCLRRLISLWVGSAYNQESVEHTREIHDIRIRLQQYKTHIWDVVEYVNDAIVYVEHTVLSRIDRLQQHLLAKFISLLKLRSWSTISLIPYYDGILGSCINRILDYVIRHWEVLPFLSHTGIWHDKQLDSHTVRCMYRRSLFFKSFLNMYVCLRLPAISLDRIQKCQRTPARIDIRALSVFCLDMRSASRKLDNPNVEKSHQRSCMIGRIFRWSMSIIICHKA